MDVIGIEEIAFLVFGIVPAIILIIYQWKADKMRTSFMKEWNIDKTTLFALRILYRFMPIIPLTPIKGCNKDYIWTIIIADICILIIISYLFLSSIIVA